MWMLFQLEEKSDLEVCLNCFSEDQRVEEVMWGYRNANLLRPEL